MGLAVDVSRDSSVVLVHDVVNSFLDPEGRSYDSGIPRMMKNIASLLAVARQARLSILFAAPGPGGTEIGPRPSVLAAANSSWGTPACDVPATLGPLPGEIILRKPRYGAFFGTRLAAMLRDMRRDTMIICGLSLAGGIETSVRDAHNHDLRSILVADSCLCRSIPNQGWGQVSREEVEKVTLSLLSQRFARVATTAEICRELQ